MRAHVCSNNHNSETPRANPQNRNQNALTQTSIVPGLHQSIVILTLLLQQPFQVHIPEQKICRLMQYSSSHSPHKRRSVALMEACVYIVEKVDTRPTTAQKNNITVLSR
jgi:hypothetical protein